LAGISGDLFVAGNIAAFKEKVMCSWAICLVLTGAGDVFYRGRCGEVET
jgi:hypothetical protein